MRFQRLFLLVPGLLTIAACSSKDASGSGGSSSSSNSTTSCEKCVAVPAGFKGPVSLSEGAPACAAPKIEGGYIGSPFTAPPAECGCQCTSPNANCDVEGTAYDSADCSGTSATFDATPPFCSEAPDLGAPVLAVSVVATPNDTTYCTTDDAPATRPDVKFDPRVSACDIGTGSCSGGACVPAKTTKYCVYSLTAKACPAGFDEMHRVIQKVDLDDTRDCSCNCGFPVDITCSPTVTCSGDSMCIGDFSSSAVGDCISGDDGDTIVAIDVMDGAVADCSDVEYVLGGTVKIGGDGVLVCCTPG